MYKLTKQNTLTSKLKFEIDLTVYPDVDGMGIVRGKTETGHNQEFYDKESTFTYVILSGSARFFINDEPVDVSAGDCITIKPKNRFYFKGSMEWLLLTTPAWKPENEVEVRSCVW